MKRKNKLNGKKAKQKQTFDFCWILMNILAKVGSGDCTVEMTYNWWISEFNLQFPKIFQTRSKRWFNKVSFDSFGSTRRRSFWMPPIKGKTIRRWFYIFISQKLFFSYTFNEPRSARLRKKLQKYTHIHIDKLRTF